MHPLVRLRAPDGQLHDLFPGDMIGRLATAALPIDDGRVSEAHAMVSLREGELRLIGLRGAFAVDGRPTAEVPLQEGLRIQLARGLWLVVEHVSLPDSVLGLESDSLPAQGLPGVCSVRPGPRLVRGWREDALAWIWSTGDDWTVRIGDAPPRSFGVGDTLRIGGEDLRVVALPLGLAGHTPTRQAGGVDAPMRIVARYDTVHIHREGEVVSAFGGIHARLVGELVSMGGSAPWRVLAAELWSGLTDDALLRSRLDVTLSRLRRRLRTARVRTDLVRSDGTGTIEILLYPHDHLDDQT